MTPMMQEARSLDTRGAAPAIPSPREGAWYTRPGGWLWGVLAIGALLRLFLVVFSDGSNDVGLVEAHARAVAEGGLSGAYRSSPLVNHPPLALLLFRWTLAFSEWTGLAFPILWRLPFAALDLMTAWLLLQCLRPNPLRYVLVAAYWLSPIAVILSAFHGNTDTTLAAITLGCVLLTRAERSFWAGALIGLGLWIKLPIVLIAPLVLAAAPSEGRLRLIGGAFAVTLIGYAPAFYDIPILAERVFGYGGIVIKAANGAFIWGPQSYYNALTVLPEAWWPAISRGVSAYYGWNGPICLSLVVAYSALASWRGVNGARLGAVLFAAYAVFYSANNMFAFQYLGWSAPLCFLVSPRFGAIWTALLGGYLWAAYGLACSSPLLIGPFDLISQPWPTWLMRLRDAAFFFTLGTALTAVVRELRPPRA